VTTPFRSFSDVLVMTEQTRLEPGVLGLKFHVRGFGQVKESVARSLLETGGFRPHLLRPQQ
jgi:ribosomal protein S11